MKKIFKILGIVLILLVAAVIILPIVFKGQIEQQVRDTANEELNAKFDFSSVELSLISDFPEISLDINDVSIVGIDDFEGVKLIEIKSLQSTVGFWSVFGDQISIKKVIIDNPKIDIRVLENGKANYDIAKESDSTEADVDADSNSGEAMNIDIQHYEIINADFSYNDATMPVNLSIIGLNHQGSGDLGADNTFLETHTSIDVMDLKYDGVKYINKVKLDWKADLDLDLKNSKYTFKENEFKVNELLLAFDGWIAMLNDNIDMDITYSTSESSFKQILSMVPAEFAADLNGVNVSGKMNLKGYVKGTFNDNLMPGFGVDLDVNDGRFQYPDLPKAVENIQIDAHVDTKGGKDFNDLQVDVAKFYMELASNPIDIKLKVIDAMTDPLIDMSVRAKVVLDNLKDVIPLEKGDALEGTMSANMSMKGRVSSLENEEYDKFSAEGDMQVDGIDYHSDSLPYNVNIQYAKLVFTPSHLNLIQFKANIGKSDIQAQGKVSNYIAYALKDDKIKGDFTITSALLDLNEMMMEDETIASGTATTTEESSSEDLAVIDIPGNVDFNLSAALQEMKYGDISMKNVRGMVRMNNHIASLEGMEMDILEGKMKMDGAYNTQDINNPSIDFDIDMINIDIKKSAEMFYTIEKMAPLAKSCQGKVSTKMKLTSVLDKSMEPVVETMSGGGNMEVKEVYIEKFEPLNKLAETLNIDRLSQQSFKDVKLTYLIENGNMIVKPFNVKIDGIDAEIEGTTGIVDQAINYTVKMEMPYSRLPKQATGAMSGVMSQINSKLGSNISMSQKIPINIRITGTVTNPKIATNYGDIVKDKVADIKEEIKNQVKEEVGKKIDEGKAEAKKKAKAEADKILADAKKQADKLLADAKRLADQGKVEAYKQADKVEKSYKNVLEKAAKKLAAKKLREKADKAHKKALDTAKQKSDKILADARKRSDDKINSVK